MQDAEHRANFTYDLVVSLRWDIGVNHIGPIFFLGFARTLQSYTRNSGQS